MDQDPVADRERPRRIGFVRPEALGQSDGMLTRFREGHEDAALNRGYPCRKMVLQFFKAQLLRIEGPPAELDEQGIVVGHRCTRNEVECVPRRPRGAPVRRRDQLECERTDRLPGNFIAGQSMGRRNSLAARTRC